MICVGRDVRWRGGEGEVPEIRTVELYEADYLTAGMVEKLLQFLNFERDFVTKSMTVTTVAGLYAFPHAGEVERCQPGTSQCPH